MRPVKRILTIAGARIIAQLASAKDQARAREVFKTSDWKILIVAEPTNPPPGADDHDTPTDVAILGACTVDQQKAETIARKCGLACNAYFRSRLTRLRKQGRLVRPVKGQYRLPE